MVKLVVVWAAGCDVVALRLAAVDKVEQDVGVGGVGGGVDQLVEVGAFFLQPLVFVLLRLEFWDALQVLCGGGHGAPEGDGGFDRLAQLRRRHSLTRIDLKEFSRKRN